jgi:hypothetical protein
MVGKTKADRQAKIRIEADKKERYSGAEKKAGTSRAVQGMKH